MDQVSPRLGYTRTTPNVARGEINLDMEILVAWRQLRSGERVVLGSVGWSDLVER